MRAVGFRQFHKVAIGRVLRTLFPDWKMRDVVSIRNKGATDRFAGFQQKQRLPRLNHREPVLLSLAQNTRKSQLRDGAGSQIRNPLFGQARNLSLSTPMEFVMKHTQRNQ